MQANSDMTFVKGLSSQLGFLSTQLYSISPFMFPDLAMVLVCKTIVIVKLPLLLHPLDLVFVQTAGRGDADGLLFV